MKNCILAIESSCDDSSIAIIDKDNFTFTQAGTLPFMYKVNNRPYVLKGWYKGKEKPDKLNEITRTALYSTA